MTYHHLQQLEESQVMETMSPTSKMWSREAGAIGKRDLCLP
jgi:hypothetical protein